MAGLRLLLLLLNGLVGWCHLVSRSARGRRHHHGLLVLAAVAGRVSSMTSWGFNFRLINHICLSIIFLLKLLDVVLEGRCRIVRGSRPSLSSATVLHQ